MRFTIFILPAIVAAQSMSGMTMPNATVTGAVSTKAANGTSAIASATKSAGSAISSVVAGATSSIAAAKSSATVSGTSKSGSGAAQTAMPFLGAIAGAGLAFAGLL